jgi:hypothetical protein
VLLTLALAKRGEVKRWRVLGIVLGSLAAVLAILSLGLAAIVTPPSCLGTERHTIWAETGGESQARSLLSVRP